MATTPAYKRRASITSGTKGLLVEYEGGVFTTPDDFGPTAVLCYQAGVIMGQLAEDEEDLPYPVQAGQNSLGFKSITETGTTAGNGGTAAGLILVRGAL